MALSYRSFQKARNILGEVRGDNFTGYSVYDPERPHRQHMIIISSENVDGGVESVHLNVKDITPEQLDIFNRRNEEIGNNSICREVEPGITRIGWF